MKNDSNKTKEQLIAELDDLRNKSKKPIEKLKAGNHPPMRFLTAAFAFTFIVFVFVLFGYYSWDSYKVAKDSMPQFLVSAGLKEAILYYDEALSMSAKMASVTGDLTWEKRYKKFEADLNQTIKQLISIYPESFISESAVKTNSANIKLVAIEHRVFESVKMGKLDEAKALLASEAYQKEKEIYAIGMRQIEKYIESQTDHLIKKQSRHLFLLILSLIFALPLLIITWIVTNRKFILYLDKRKQAEEKLNAANQQLLASEQQLRAANQQLEANNQQLVASEKSLQESGEMLHNSQTLAHICAYSTDLNINEFGKSTWKCSPELYKIFGIDETYPHTLEGWAGFIHPDYREELFAYHQYVINERIPFNKVYKIVRINDRAERWVHGTGETTYDKKGTPIRMHGAIQDITERKQAEEALKESEERFRSVFSNLSNIAVQGYDKDRKITFWNKASEALYGYSQEEVVNKKLEDLIIPNEMKETVISLIKNWHEKNIKIPNDELILIKKDKSPIQVFSSHVMIENTGGEKEMFCIDIDITERKQAEEALREIEAVQSKMVANIGDVIVIIDDKGLNRYKSPNIEKLFGWKPEELVGQSTWDNVHPDDLEHGKSFIGSLLEEANKTGTTEVRYKRKDGSYCYIQFTAVNLFHDSDINGILGNYHDITERKQAEEALKESEERFRSVFSNLSNIAVQGYDKDRKITFWNKASEALYGYSQEEVVNKKLEDLIIPNEMKETVISLIKNWHEKNIKIPNDELILIKKDKSPIQVFSSHVMIENTGGEKEMFCIDIDITERKQAEEELIKAKEKAEESNRLKTAFLNNMSHEIRTPLNGITGFIGLLQDSEIDAEKKKEFFDIINKSSNRLIATVTDILDISRIEAGEVKVSKTEVSVNKILEEQYSFFNCEAKSKGLELNYKPGLTDGEARFVTDKHKLEGILTNLIKNAIKYTEEGEITFACSLKKEKDINVLEFYVKDTGIGIPANRTEAIFNRFEQADIEDTRAHQGSGLGLAIAKSYVEMLGGTIRVISEVGLGSTFTFSIPYTKQFVKESDVKGNINKEPLTSLSKLSVIIAEDDETSKLFFDAIFKNEFNKITYTKTGQETIDLCRKNPETDLILMDIKMPDINGYEATREIRKFNSDVVIIAQTAF
ncbi:MAG: PAS domain S-box protein, partial [Bacteroidetes bacterium]|nr:PAS domain S-box protein [Bacteroidota bacterium]